MALQNMKEVLHEVLDRTGLDKKINECKSILLWNDVASSMSARTEPIEVYQGRLIVNVTDSVILHTLTFYKRKYIEKINLLSGKQVIKDIVFRVGKVEKRRPVVENRDDYIRRLHATQLNRDELDRIDDVVAQIEDVELRDSLRKLFINQSKLSKVREGYR